MEIIRVDILRVDVSQVLDLRHRILRAGLSRAAANFEGDELPDTVHIAALEGGTVVGCATVLSNSFNGERACQLRGMAVDPALQARGIGRKLLAEVERVAVERGVTLLWANCRKPAVGFYRRHGWVSVSEDVEIPTAGPHFRMMRRLDGV
jgi:N-acetylglutamate synthase-like GNAT family acetyltransferase